MKYYTQFLLPVAVVSASDLPFLDLSKISKRADSSCTDCTDAGNTLVDECNITSLDQLSTDPSALTCMCQLGSSFWDDLSKCAKSSCSGVDVSTSETSPSGLKNDFCQNDSVNEGSLLGPGSIFWLAAVALL